MLFWAWGGLHSDVVPVESGARDEGGDDPGDPREDPWGMAELLVLLCVFRWGLDGD